jgi:alkyldihydroxyacetonephosphate synthase
VNGRREQVTWGWGEPGAGPSLPPHADAVLRERFGVPGGVIDTPAAVADIVLPEPALAAETRERLEGIVGAGHVRSDHEARVLRATGKSYLDLLAQRSGALEAAPDAVVAPGSAAEVQAVLYACAEGGVAVVPFAGGTSVVGGVAPDDGGLGAVVTLDLGRLTGLLSVDRASRTARLAPGTRLPEADHALASHGFTLGHHPQSYEWATVGGCVATRSSGQASTGFGRIEENVVALSCATPTGTLSTLAVPATAAGPSLKELLIGSEGTLGVITETTLAVRPLARERRYEAWFAHSFEEGCAALRELAQAESAPDVARLSDETETEVTLGLSRRPGREAQIGGALLRARGYAGGCALVTGWEGEPAEVGRRRSIAARVLRDHGAMFVGRRPGKAWSAGRYGAPHLRDDLMDRGVLVETLETATTWGNLPRLHMAVRAALESALGARGTAPIVSCHVSHLYAAGASLYFTVLARQDRGDPAGQWIAAKDAACRAIAGAGGTITHHHAIGRDHAPYLGAELGGLGLELLRAVKQRCDPAGVMNPGKLLAG